MKRLKIFILIFIFFINSHILYAQIINDFGINVGLNYSTIGIVNYHQWADFRTGFNVGCYLEFFDTPFLNLMTSVNYSQMGFRENWYRYYKPITRLDFISIPILIKIKYPKFHLLPYLFAGPSFNFLINRNPGQFEDSENYSPIADRLKDRDITTIIGIGITTSRILKIPSFFEIFIDFSYKKNIGEGYIYKATGWGVYLKEYQTYYYYSFKCKLGIKLSELFL